MGGEVLHMKKVALFVDDMNRHAFFERLSGIQERGQELGLDLTLHVFHSRASFGLDCRPMMALFWICSTILRWKDSGTAEICAVV